MSALVADSVPHFFFSFIGTNAGGRKMPLIVHFVQSKHSFCECLEYVPLIQEMQWVEKIYSWMFIVFLLENQNNQIMTSFLNREFSRSPINITQNVILVKLAIFD